ncbi:glycosyltransferase family 39 protein [Streptomyces sp. NPDC048717]|uniref:glycosyltransferase family 39 protein n=1 Tax=Streptomyces sp. NPDC048717 TaxID=3154928 RepID=UPI00343112B6
MLARVSLTLFGVSAPGLRLWAALAAAGTVAVGALTAREFGGERRAQLLAALATATMPVLLGAGHIANTTPYETLAWAAIALVVVRLGRTGDTRWWLAVGALAGVGAEFNHLAAILGAVLLATTLLVPAARRTVADRRLVAGVAIAVLIVLPDLWWQARHGWAMTEMTRALNAEHGGPANIVVWVVGQLGVACVALIPLWVAGLRLLWRADRPLWRCLAIAYAVLSVLFAVTTGAQIYYLAGLYVCLLAAGATVFAGSLPRLLTRTAVATAVFALIVLPVLPPSTAGLTSRVSSNSAESVGWPELVGTVREVWDGLPAGQRAHAVLFAANYGEAGALNELGRGSGLPTAVSPHNSEWWWGPGDPRATTVVAVAPGPEHAPEYAAYLRRFFRHVTVAATLSNTAGVHNIEWGGHVYLCAGPRRPWGDIWPGLRHYA